MAFPLNHLQTNIDVIMDRGEQKPSVPNKVLEIFSEQDLQFEKNHDKIKSQFQLKTLKLIMKIYEKSFHNQNTLQDNHC